MARQKMRSSEIAEGDDWLQDCLPLLSAAANEENLYRAMSLVKRDTGAVALHLSLSAEELPDWSFQDGTRLQCGWHLPPRKVSALVYTLPLLAGERRLGELRFHFDEKCPSDTRLKSAAHLLAALLRAATAAAGGERWQAHQELQQILVHDLRSPLATLRSYLKLLANGGREAADVAEYWPALNRLADQQDELLSRLLALYEAHESLECAKPLRIQRLLQMALAEQEEAAALADLRLEAKFAIRPNLRLVAAELPLRRALANLLNNAIRYTPSGGQVQLRAWRENGRLFMSVRDDGQGLPPQLRARAFQPFVRAPVAGVLAGSGLGLSYVRAVAERGGGAVWLESEPDRGSELGFWLPLEG